MESNRRNPQKMIQAIKLWVQVFCFVFFFYQLFGSKNESLNEPEQWKHRLFEQLWSCWRMVCSGCTHLLREIEFRTRRPNSTSQTTRCFLQIICCPNAVCSVFNNTCHYPQQITFTSKRHVTVNWILQTRTHCCVRIAGPLLCCINIHPAVNTRLSRTSTFVPSAALHV